MADIRITHTRPDGTVLHGSSRGDGIYEIVRQYGFKYSRNVGIYIRNSRDKEAQHWRINGAADALRAAGHTVEVEVNEEDERSFAEIEAAREERAEDRAERFADRADRAASESNARYGRAKDIGRRFEFGQPILVGHHSERRARRDQERMHDNMRKSIEEQDKARYWSDRAEAAGSYKDRRNDTYVTLRRLEKLGADLRRQQRYHAEAVEKGCGSADRHAREIRDLEKEIAHWEEVVEKAKAGGVKVWGPQDFAPGDYVRYYGTSWYQVSRVNPKTLSIAWNLRLEPKQVMSLEDATDGGRTWTHSASYTNVHARCPEEAMNAFLADGKVPGLKAAHAASEEQPAAAVLAAQAAKPKPKKQASDPKVPKKLLVEFRNLGAVAEVTWLNGGNRPHKDFQPVTIAPPEGKQFGRSVWSQALQEELARILGEQGYELYGSDWEWSRARQGYIRSLRPKPQEAPEPEQPTAPAEEQPAAPAGEEPPVAGPEETPEPEEPAAPVEEPPADEPGETPEGDSGPRQEGENMALTCDSSGSTRNHKTPTSVVYSDYPLTPNPQEAPVTETEKYGRPLTPRERKAAQVAEMSERAAQREDVERTAELDTAYCAYVDEGIAMTDGVYVPLDFQAWAATLGAPLVAAAAAEEPPADQEQETATAPEGAEAAAEPQPQEKAPAGEAPVEKEPARKAPAKKAATKKTSARKAPTATAPAKKVVEPTVVRKRREVLADTVAEAKAKAPTQKTIPVDRIVRDPNQPRELFDQAKLEELAGSMRELGQLQPISVRYERGTKQYVIIMGERRWRAAQMAGLTEMTALVLHDAVEGSRELLAKQVAENVGRADMTPMEEAKSFKDLEKSGYEVEEIARMCGKSPAYVGWRIDLLKLCDSAQDALAKGVLGVNLAWYAAQLSERNQMRFLSRYAQGGFANDRDAEAFVKACRAEEERLESQGSFFVLTEQTPARKGDVQESILGDHDVPQEERDRIASERTALLKKVDRLSAAGEILAELATADPEELALLLAGAAGGVEVHSKRMGHLRKLTGQVIANLTKAQAIAAVRSEGIAINPDAVAPEAVSAA
ncbi:ParB/RepB/Spo0J family partition protein [Streptomyces cinereoruber]|uniref:ParB/RepB/Spo0J family partition protein n=1 Tax=Streptomyces cinereoruber TaxID=67260 RepID=UPI003635A541